MDPGVTILVESDTGYYIYFGPSDQYSLFRVLVEIANISKMS